VEEEEARGKQAAGEAPAVAGGRGGWLTGAWFSVELKSRPSSSRAAAASAPAGATVARVDVVGALKYLEPGAYPEVMGGGGDGLFPVELLLLRCSSPSARR
jgi:hypothetical protein